MKKNLTILLIIIAIILIGGTAFVYNWSVKAYDLPATVDNAMQSSRKVTVTENEKQNWIIFTPTESEPEALFIHYPGGRVPANAYAPLLHEIAAQGILVITPYMPLNLAIFGQKEADDIFEAYPKFDINVIGGHSLGGAMAQYYAHDNLERLDGFILLGSYGTEGTSLVNTNLEVLSIYGTEDGSAEEIATSTTLYPDDAQFYTIEGGNHAQFGDYGIQNGDGVAQISRYEQQKIAVKQISSFILSLDK